MEPLGGFEPPTIGLQGQRSTSWATEALIVTYMVGKVRFELTIPWFLFDPLICSDNPSHES